MNAVSVADDFVAIWVKGLSRMDALSTIKLRCRRLHIANVGDVFYTAYALCGIIRCLARRAMNDAFAVAVQEAVYESTLTPIVANYVPSYIFDYISHETVDFWKTIYDIKIVYAQQICGSLKWATPRSLVASNVTKTDQGDDIMLTIATANDGAALRLADARCVDFTEQCRIKHLVYYEYACRFPRLDNASTNIVEATIIVDNAWRVVEVVRCIYFVKNNLKKLTIRSRRGRPNVCSRFSFCLLDTRVVEAIILCRRLLYLAVRVCACGSIRDIVSKTVREIASRCSTLRSIYITSASCEVSTKLIEACRLIQAELAAHRTTPLRLIVRIAGEPCRLCRGP